MRFFDTMRVAMVATMLVSASGAKNQRRRVGYFIFGSNLGNLPVSQNERIHHAFQHATTKHRDDEHVYFASGKTAPGVEAYYIREELLELYAREEQEEGSRRKRSLPEPIIIKEDKALFTVDNVLKTLTLINDQRLDCVYMVSSDYHLERAAACYEAFSDIGLCRYPLKRDGVRQRGVLMEKLEALHERRYLTDEESNRRESHVDTVHEEIRENGGIPKERELHLRDEIYLRETPIPKHRQRCLCMAGEGSHAIYEEQIRCPARDSSNSRIFAYYINLMKVNGLTRLDELCGRKELMNERRMRQYLFNNGKISSKKFPLEKMLADDSCNGCFDMFTRFVHMFVDDSKQFWSRSASPRNLKRQRTE